jgi:hypothetical protein
VVAEEHLAKTARVLTTEEQRSAEFQAAFEKEQSKSARLEVNLALRTDIPNGFLDTYHLF